jgi:uncharacterized SAM-binding protein YcdF (DUF218 family)
MELPSLCLLLLVAAASLKKNKLLNRSFFWAGCGILFFSGNEWVVAGLVGHLERQYLPHEKVPEMDCILVLSGGTLGHLPPRSTIEVDDAGDRVLYGAYLYRERKAPFIICTGGTVIGGTSIRPAAEDMAELLELLGVPKDSIIKETKARNTHEHAINLRSVFAERGFKRILLVTSAMHMPRAIGVFEHVCPETQFVAAPTDFRVTRGFTAPWYYAVIALIPTPHRLLDASEALHEYFGIFYYRVRGWM